jgi:hypothetical protein
VSTWTNSHDRVLRTNLRVVFRLDVTELAQVLAYAIDNMYVELDDPAALAAAPADRIEELVRTELRDSGLSNLMNGRPTQAHIDAVRRTFGGPEVTL